MSETTTPAPKLAVSTLAMFALILAMLFGIGVSVYMAQHHEISVYGGPDAQFELVGCAEAEGVSCDVVNTSAWSEVFGVPTFAWAIPTYFVIGALSLLVIRGQRAAAWLIVAAGIGTSLFSAWLWYVSVTELQNVCLWCMRLYAVNFGTLVLGLLAVAPLGGKPWAERPQRSDLIPAAVGFAIFAVVTVGVQQVYRATLLGDAPAADLAAASLSAPPDPGEAGDPEGTLRARTVTVTTEDGKPATLHIRPDDAWKGNPDGKVTMVEFADLECGFCKRAASELKKVHQAYGDRVLFVFKHYPMDNQCNPGVKSRKHRDACNAAIASICAQDQGRFWGYHDLAFKNQHELDVDALRLYAESLDLDMATWNTCVRSPEARARLQQSAQDGADLDIHGTPRIFIDGTLYRSGSSALQLAKALETALGVRGTEANARLQALGQTGSDPVKPIPADVAEMQQVGDGGNSFLIDTFEAGLDDEGKAVVGKHVIPATRMSWYAARDACQAVGKRMCTEQEWIGACQGAPAIDDDNDRQYADDMIEGSAWPYGELHEPQRCWSARNDETERPVYTGEMPGCVSADGVYDLVGNVEEWVGDSPETAVLLGGAYDTPDDKARCYRRNDTFGAGYANRRTGFRCCQNADAGDDTDAQ